MKLIIHRHFVTHLFLLGLGMVVLGKVLILILYAAALIVDFASADTDGDTGGGTVAAAGAAAGIPSLIPGFAATAGAAALIVDFASAATFGSAVRRIVGSDGGTGGGATGFATAFAMTGGT